MRKIDTNSRRISRRTFISSAGVGGAALMAGCTGGDGGDGGDGTDFPNQDITFVIPYGPGGGFDEYVRTTAKFLSEDLPVDVVPQNTEGAGGQIAMNQVYNAEPDGYTNILMNTNNFIRQQIIEDVEYDMSDITIYPQITADPTAIGVGTNTDIETFEDYVEKASNEELRYYHTGYMGISFMTPYMVGDVSGLYPGDNINGSDVIFDGRGEGIQAILAGDVEVMAANWSSLLPYAESGDLRILLVCTNEEELPGPLEEVNPGAETLLTADVDNAKQIEDMLSVRRIYAGPSGIPEDRTAVLREALDELLQDDEFLDHMDKINRPVRYQNSEDAASSIETAFENWSEREGLLMELAGQE